MVVSLVVASAAAGWIAHSVSRGDCRAADDADDEGAAAGLAHRATAPATCPATPPITPPISPTEASAPSAIPPAAPAPADPVATASPALPAARTLRPPGTPLVAEPKSLKALPEIRITSGYFLQVGAFAVKANAEALREKLRRDLGSTVAMVVIKPQGKLDLVQIGPWPAPADARETRKNLQEQQGMASILVRGSVESPVLE